MLGGGGGSVLSYYCFACGFWLVASLMAFFFFFFNFVIPCSVALLQGKLSKGNIFVSIQWRS